MQDKIEAVNSMLAKLRANRKKGRKYAFVSYSEADRDRAYELIELLLRNGVELTTCEESGREEVSDIVKSADCKCMIALISRAYIYNIDNLLDQYTRFLDDVRNNSENKQQLPCVIIDLDDSRCKYKDDILTEFHEKKNQSIDMAKHKDALRKGLQGLYQLDGGNIAKLIERQIEAVETGDMDEIRKQMSFILDYDGHLDNVTNREDILNYPGNTVRRLINQGVAVDKELKKICTDHFDEWGKNSYIFTMEQGKPATIVCAQEELYIKSGSFVKENPTKDRSKNEKLNSIYKKYMMNGILKPASDICFLCCQENIRDNMSLSEATMFVNGEGIEDCSGKWINVKTGKTYREENGEVAEHE